MQTFTAGLTPIEAIRAALPHKYAMELNRDDMVALLEGLNEAWMTSDDQDVSERAFNLRSSILTTIGIEEV